MYFVLFPLPKEDITSTRYVGVIPQTENKAYKLFSK
jgi:hypothetical protein